MVFAWRAGAGAGAVASRWGGRGGGGATAAATVVIDLDGESEEGAEPGAADTEVEGESEDPIDTDFGDETGSTQPGAPLSTPATFSPSESLAAVLRMRSPLTSGPADGGGGGAAAGPPWPPASLVSSSSCCSHSSASSARPRVQREASAPATPPQAVTGLFNDTPTPKKAPRSPWETTEEHAVKRPCREQPPAPRHEPVSHPPQPAPPPCGAQSQAGWPPQWGCPAPDEAAPSAPASQPPWHDATAWRPEPSQFVLEPTQPFVHTFVPPPLSQPPAVTAAVPQPLAGQPSPSPFLQSRPAEALQQQPPAEPPQFAAASAASRQAPHQGCGASASSSGVRGRPWARCHPTPLDQRHSLTFFLVTLDEHLETPPFGFAAHGAGQAPVLDLHGVTRDGRSVLLHVHGFLPYLYARRPEGNGEVVELCRQALNATATRSSAPVVAFIEEVARTPLMPYQPDHEPLLRIGLSNQRLVSSCRNALERGLRLRNGATWQSPAYEANVSLALRFLVDVGIGGGSWVEVPAGRYQLREGRARKSHAGVEADAHWRSLVGHGAEGEWMALAPLRLLTLHLTSGPEDRIVAAGALLQVHGEAAPTHQMMWFLSETGAGDQATHSVGRAAALGPIGEEGAAADASVFRTEAELLASLRDYVVETDADVVIGYDLLNVHLSNLLARAEATGLTKRGAFGLGRLVGVPTKVKAATFETRQMGKHETKEINVEGRLLFDALTVLEREQKLCSYSLSAVALQFLGVTRIEFRSAKVDQLSREDPGHLAKLALRDAGLCLKLFEKQFFLFRYVEMARVTGVPMEYLLTRGQSVKVFSMLLRKARANDYVLPPPPRNEGASEDGTYEGGYVLDPLVGFYEEPIVTLDFASLYPSIMQRHNLCYTTMLAPGDPAPELADGEPGVEVVPILGHRFVSARVRRGLVPMVLEELLAARARAKKEMKSAPDAQTRAVLDGRQLALKVSANSVYGFTGMNKGTLPCQAIAASVTAYGRKMIEHTKEVVEGHFCRAKGYPRDARVIYGDTDSVMVTLGKGCELQQVFAFGKEAAEVVSRQFGAPIKMEFEKVYFPYLLMNKKRYAGLAWNRPEEPGKLDAKGIETVRRDWCELVREVVERCLELLLRERSAKQAVAYVQRTVADLRQGKVDPRRLVLSKSLVRDGAESYTAKQAHVELAEKLRKRSPALAPQVGDRVPYVFVVAASGTPAYDKAEDPLWAFEQNLPIDADYYIEHQLKQPVLRIFEPVLGSGGAADLFAGDHTRKVASRAVGSGPLAAFARARPKCLGCRALLQGHEGVLCHSCEEPDRAAEVVVRYASELRPLETEASQLLTQCARCEGSNFRGLSKDCANVDCPIFFRRLQVARELGAAQSSLEKLRLDW